MFPLLSIEQGTCYVLFAYDVGWAIALGEAERRITELKQRPSLKQKRLAPRYFEYRPAPLRVIQEAEPFELGGYRSRAGVDLVLYDFGAVSVSYEVPIEGPFARLLEFSRELYDSPVLLDDSRRRVDRLVTLLNGAVEKPEILESVEDYVIFQIEEAAGSAGSDLLTPTHAQEIARLLRGELLPLSDQEVMDATSCHIAYGTDDAAIVDWNAALLFGREMEDVRAVLEFANVELVEARCLDRQLDEALDRGYDTLSRRLKERLRWPGSFEAEVQRLAQFQMDSAVLFERVTNSLKLLGDQYLARVYRLVSRRFHLEEWESSIVRKLQMLESIYTKMSDRAASRRMEMLEWVIILLIALSIVLSFVP